MKHIRLAIAGSAALGLVGCASNYGGEGAIAGAGIGAVVGSYLDGGVIISALSD